MYRFYNLFIKNLQFFRNFTDFKGYLYEIYSFFLNGISTYIFKRYLYISKNFEYGEMSMDCPANLIYNVMTRRAIL